MLEILNRPVWDCCVPAAFRDDIFVPEKTATRGLPEWERIEPVRKSQPKKKRSTTTRGGEVPWTAAISGFFNGNEERQIDEDTLPPPIYFELHDLPQAPTW